MKLYSSLREKIEKTRLTKKECDALLWLLRSQDDLGVVHLVHWKEIAHGCDMVAQSFYNAMYGLADKGFIEFMGHSVSHGVSANGEEAVSKYANKYTAENEGMELDADANSGASTSKSACKSSSKGTNGSKDASVSKNENSSRGLRGYHSIQIIIPTAPAELPKAISPSKAISSAEKTSLLEGHTLSKEIPTQATTENSAQTATETSTQTAAELGLVSVEVLKDYISKAGTYLNLRDCQLVYSNNFRKLLADSKKLMLHILFKRQTALAMAGRVKDGKRIVPHDIAISPENAARILGYDWSKGKSGEVIRRKMGRYIQAVASFGLAGMFVDDSGVLRWAFQDMRRDLPMLSMKPCRSFSENKYEGRHEIKCESKYANKYEDRYKGNRFTGDINGSHSSATINPNTSESNISNSESAGITSYITSYITSDMATKVLKSLGDANGISPIHPLYPIYPINPSDSLSDIPNRRLINIILHKTKITTNKQDIQDTLRLLDEQYRSVSGLKILASGVKMLVKDCLLSCGTLIPSYINVKVRELLGLVPVRAL